MPYKDKVVARAAAIRGAAKHRRLKREWLESLKGGPCMDCGGTFDPVAMDFDHRDASQKHFKVSMARTQGWTRKRVLDEIAKCDLVCANCHRVRTKNRRLARA